MNKVQASLVLLLLSVCLSFTGCRNDKINGTWKLVSIERNGVAEEVFDATLCLIDEGDYVNIYGNAGVNDYNGSMRLLRRKVIPGDFIQTKMAGPENLMGFENLFLDTLKNMSRFTADLSEGSEMITIECTDTDTVARFKRYRIDDVKWILTAINDRDYTPPEGSDSVPYVIFNSDGTLSAFTGVNVIQSSYINNIYIQHIKVLGDGASTLALGTEEESALESAFCKNLFNIESYAMTGTEIIFRGRDGKILLVFDSEPN